MTDLELTLPDPPAPPPEPYTEAHSIRVVLGTTPRATEVWIDGRDVSYQIASVRIDAPADDVTRLTLEMINLGKTKIITVTGILTVEPDALKDVL